MMSTPTTALDEATLIARARAADQAAFAELVTRHDRVLWSVCLRITGNTADAEDAVQDTLIAAWQHLDRFRADARFSTWLYRIASNAALAVVRRRRPQQELPEELLLGGPSFESRVADRDVVRRALESVPEAFREALVLREFGGFTYAEIASRQGIPVQTVKTRVHRARAGVRAALLPR